MKIAGVEPFVVPYIETNDHGSTRYVCLVRVVTDDGIVGWGEGVTLFEEATRATYDLVVGLREFLIGVEAAPHAAGEAMRARMWWYGEGGIASFALSAIDIALWDIQGRAQNRSLLDLLGGAAHDSLPILSSGHAALADLDEQCAVVADWVDQAASLGVKIAFGKNGDADLGVDFDRDVSFVRTLRRALGPSPRIMIDIGARIRWSLADAIARTRAFEDSDIDWIEEPLGADDPQGYAALKAATTILMAYGEREWTARGIERIVETGTVDVVGIDPGRAEGVTGFHRASRHIVDVGVQANAHAFAGPITYAASLALSLASPACHQLEVPPTLNQLYEVVGLPERPSGGRVVALSGPGLGFDIDEKGVRTASVT
jgi:L-alanine-DL-glutamate epimerase-like enolase superfamily enzyme